MRFSYAVVALFGAAHAIPTVGSLVTGRSVCNTGDCQGVARAVVADQAAIDARKKTRQAKSDAANATATAETRRNAESKRSKKLAQIEARQNATDVEARALGDTVDTLVGDVTGTVGDVTGGVGLKTRDGKEVRAAVADEAAVDARQQSRQAKSAAANATAEARSVTDEAAVDARQQSRQAKSAAANGTAKARSVEVNDNKNKNKKARKSRRSHQLW